MSFNAKEQKDKVVTWIRDWVESHGAGKNVIVGISGGKDSTVVAALCVEALGKDRVIGVLLPDGCQMDIDDSLEVCRFLGIKKFTVNIRPAKDSLVFWTETEAIKPSKQAMINLPARLRMTELYFVSQSSNGFVVNTCNLSEDYIGYSTRYGDSAGDFGPLKSFTTDEVIAIGEELGLPHHLIHKAPSDGLCGKTDEDNLGFTYDVLNRYIRTGEIDDLAVKEKIDTLHALNEFKERVMDKYEYTPE